MTDFTIKTIGERITGWWIPNAIPLFGDEQVIDVPVAVVDTTALTQVELQAVSDYLIDKKVVSGAFVVQDATDIKRFRNERTTPDITAVEYADKIGDEAVRLFDEAITWVTGPRKYYPTEQRTWGKQEKVAEEWLNNWNAGSPTIALTDDRYKVLVNLCAGELNIAKAAVTDTNAFDKATSIMVNSGDISPYYASVLGALHLVTGTIQTTMDDLEATTIDEATAVSQLLAIDLENIQAIALAELGL